MIGIYQVFLAEISKTGTKINKLASFLPNTFILVNLTLQPAYIQPAIDLLNDAITLQVDVLRMDVIDPVISGNKWFKLKNYLAAATAAQKKSILTFGGAFSNHIVATAAACKQLEFKCTGIIRGEKPRTLSHTLQHAQDLGMQLVFTPRSDYREKRIPAPLAGDDFFIIPEGGYGIPGADGIAAMLQSYNLDAYTHIFCAVGTGTMMAGLIKGAPATSLVTGIPVLKSMPGIKHEIKALLPGDQAQKPFMLRDGFHFNGYARHNKTLTDFMNRLYTVNNIPTDFVYTGKLFYAVSQITKEPGFSAQKILVIHSGGLQGNHSLPKGTLIF